MIQETLLSFPSGFLTECNFTQDSPGPAPLKTKEPSPRIWKIQVIITCLESSLPALWHLYTFLGFPFCQLLPGVFSSLPHPPVCWGCNSSSGPVMGTGDSPPSQLLRVDQEISLHFSFSSHVIHHVHQVFCHVSQ